jgi:AraC family transcriptional regulator of adaptative response/methylated-DNA-[protein]-cysteine methyltransferase
MTEDSINYSRIEKAIKYLNTHFKKQPSLTEIASHVNMSEFHFQRIFTEWAGISPKKFLQYLTIEELKKEIKKAPNLTDAAERVGLSAQSRVYDLFINIEAITPQEYKLQAAGIHISYGFHPTPFGECCIAITAKGICSLYFVDNNHTEIFDELHKQWPKASLMNDQESTRHFVRKIFYDRDKQKLNLFLKGTKFQIKVWEALLKIPNGSLSTYQHIALTIDSRAVRAVGSAIANNPIAYLIPCHRVIRSEGVIGQYHWRPERKVAIIGWEKAKSY